MVGEPMLAWAAVATPTAAQPGVVSPVPSKVNADFGRH
jgi:hypothetical protein